MRLALCIATMMPHPEIPEPVLSLTRTATSDLPVHWRRNSPLDNIGVIESYIRLSDVDADILAFIHDDVVMIEPGWDERVLKEFENPTVAVVGFGGALQHGSSRLYKVPYVLQQLARFNYLSNTADAEAHGERFAGSCDVAVLDGFALIVRRDFLIRSGGWPRVTGGFHCYDYAICALARRWGYRVRLVGAACHHLGGRTSTTPQYLEWAERSLKYSDQEIHEMSHRYIYANFRDVLPYRVDDGYPLV